MTTDTVLAEAARAIHADGWTTVAARQRGDERLSWAPAAWTLVEAVEYVVPNDGETERRVLDVLRARAGTDDLDAWNEAPGRTMEDVLALLHGSVGKRTESPSHAACPNCGSNDVTFHVRQYDCRVCFPLGVHYPVGTDIDRADHRHWSCVRGHRWADPS